MRYLPETIIQFGSGRFLRAFADLFIHQANLTGQDVGRVVIVQSTGTQRAGALSDSDGKYHVLVRGIENGTVVDREETCSSVSRALAAATDWPEVLNVARSPELKAILSNTTEAGYEVDSSDLPGMCPPRSFLVILPPRILNLLSFLSGDFPLWTTRSVPRGRNWPNRIENPVPGLARRLAIPC